MRQATLAELSPTLEGKSVTAIVSEISLEELGKEYRMQKVIFETARDVYDQMRPGWKGNKEYLLSQVIGLVEKFMLSDKIQIAPLLFEQDPVRQ